MDRENSRRANKPGLTVLQVPYYLFGFAAAWPPELKTCRTVHQWICFSFARRCFERDSML